MIILGLKCYSHDTGAAIVSDESGSLVIHAISEARLNRRKHSFTYPLMSIAYCLNALGLEHLDQVDRICIDRHMEIWPEQGSQLQPHAPCFLTRRRSSITRKVATEACPEAVFLNPVAVEILPIALDAHPKES